jgi:hypothetical protein
MPLNDNQRKIVMTGLILFLLLGLFPPWTYTLDAQSIHREKPAYYSFIALPPKPEFNSVTHGVKIDISRLIVQWVILAAAVSLGVFVTRHKE